jgi:hypothetical protein
MKILNLSYRIDSLLFFYHITNSGIDFPPCETYDCFFSGFKFPEQPINNILSHIIYPVREVA